MRGALLLTLYSALVMARAVCDAGDATCLVDRSRPFMADSMGVLEFELERLKLFVPNTGDSYTLNLDNPEATRLLPHAYYEKQLLYVCSRETHYECTFIDGKERARLEREEAEKTRERVLEEYDAAVKKDDEWRSRKEQWRTSHQLPWYIASPLKEEDFPEELQFKNHQFAGPPPLYGTHGSTWPRMTFTIRHK